MHHVNTNMIPVSLDDSEKPNWYSEPLMRDKEQPRSIRFPQSLWDAIDRDALRCKRSAVKQMEAVLAEYYRLASVELSHETLSKIRTFNEADSYKEEVQKERVTKAKKAR